MSRVRLLPVLVFGLTSLVVIKVLTLALDDTRLERAQKAGDAGSQFARTIARAREGQNDDQIITGAVGEKVDETLVKAVDADRKAKQMQEAIEAGKLPKPKLPSEPEGTRIVVPETMVTAKTGASDAERKLLEKLKERRGSLDSRDQELEMRENILKATERKLDEKIGQLRTLEGQNEAVPGGKNDPKTRYKPLVVMYESMKPKEAARVFDRLDVRVLLDLVGHMNPRKMSEILAVMDPAAAERLTIVMAKQAQAGNVQAAEAANANEPELARLPVAKPPSN